MNNIHYLTPKLANQIAAGEVVERPASVIKECLENCFDASATAITIVLEKSGKKTIRITDNGCGIQKNDLPLALARHATSKISTLEELENIHSLGFRGEALASIASVARLCLTSRVNTSEQAYSVNIEGNDQNAVVTPAAHPVGTTIEVNDLFFNTPVRRKFLKADNTEWFYCESLIKQLTVSHFSVAIKLIHNQRTIFNLPAAHSDLEKERRVAALYGKTFLSKTVKLDKEATGLRLWGWLGLPNIHRSQIDQQTIFVNGRVVRDKLINHALRESYQETIPVGRYPCYVLFLEVEPSMVDVNVHPTKHEVRFRQPRLIHDFIVTAIAKQLSGSSQAIALHQYSVPQSSSIANAGYTRQIEKAYVALHTPENNNSDTLLGTTIEYLHKQFLLAKNQLGLVVVNIRLAEEQLLANELFIAWEGNTVKSIPLMIPETISLDDNEIACIEHWADKLKFLGIEVETIGPETVLIRRLPIAILSKNFPAFLLAMIRCCQEKKETIVNQDVARDLIAILTAFAVFSEYTTFSEGNTLLRKLEAFGSNKPVMRKIWSQITIEELAQRFG